MRLWAVTHTRCESNNVQTLWTSIYRVQTNMRWPTQPCAYISGQESWRQHTPNREQQPSNFVQAHGTASWRLSHRRYLRPQSIGQIVYDLSGRWQAAADCSTVLWNQRNMFKASDGNGVTPMLFRSEEPLFTSPCRSRPGAPSELWCI